MDIQPIYGIPALRVNDSFVISDLHIGVETHLMKKGFHIASRTEDMYDCILENSEGCDHLIVLGDVKDAVPGSSKQEFREIPNFFERLKERFDNIDLVRGNHDTNIEEFLPEGIRVRPSTGMVIDGVGKQTTEPCWMRGKFRSGCDRYQEFPESFIVIPAFNRMLGGSPMNVVNETFLGPLMNNDYLDLDNAHMYLLDGIDLGKRSDIMVNDRYELRNLKRGPRRR